MSSATNIIPPASETGGDEKASTMRANPVALEVFVNVTGARPSGDSGSSGLFSEDTVTVLVFKDGAVIWLSAAVAVGQLIFLTNKKSNQEVVCQVMRKRSYRPTVCYVELQFTEERADFWGVTFGAGNKSGKEIKVAAQVEAEETTEDDPGTPVAPRSAEDVDQLKKEVEELRKQLLALEKKKSGETGVRGALEEEKKENPRDLVQGSPVEQPAEKSFGQSPSLDAAGVEGDALRTAPKHHPGRRQRASEGDPYKEKPKRMDETAAAEAPAVTVAKMKLELASVNDPSPEPAKAVEEVEALLMPAATEKTAPAKRVIGMALPNRMMESIKAVEAPKQATEEPKHLSEQAIDPAQDLLPKPALDFSKMPVSAVDLDENDPRSIYKPKSKGLGPEKIRMIGLGVALAVVVVGGVWHGKWWQYLPGRKKAEAVAQVKVAKAATEETRKGAAQDSPLQTKGGAPATEEARKRESQAEVGKTSGPADSSGAKAQIPGATTSDPSTSSGQALKVRPPKENPKSRPFEVQGKRDAGATKSGATATQAEEKSKPAPLQTEGGPPTKVLATGTGESKNGAAVVAAKPLKKANGTAEKKPAVVKEKAAAKAAAKKNVAASAAGEPSTVEPGVSDAPLIPAKLLKAANPVYPPNAMRNYITGDVRAEVVVEASGRVGEVKVISGPQALRAAAVEALKKYQYAPGTQGGKAVETKMETTVKFWFNP